MLEETVGGDGGEDGGSVGGEEGLIDASLVCESKFRTSQ